MTTWRRVLPLLGWLALLAAGLVLFHALGRGPMTPPPVTDPGGWSAWTAEREPAVVVAAVLRLLVLALAWYLVGVTTVGLVARLVRAAGLVRLADTVTLPRVRRLLQSALGVGLAAAMVGASTAPPSAAEGARVTVAEADDHGAHEQDEAGHEATQRTSARLVAGGAEAAEAGTGPDGPVSMRLVEQEATVGLRMADDDGDGDADDDGGDSDDVGDGGDGAVGQGRGHTTTVHDVVPGDSLWSIAHATLASTTVAEPDEAQVAAYWRRVVEHNSSRLADPDNPDLIFPGDEIVLPPVDG